MYDIDFSNDEPFDIVLLKTFNRNAFNSISISIKSISIL